MNDRLDYEDGCIKLHWLIDYTFAGVLNLLLFGWLCYTDKWLLLGWDTKQFKFIKFLFAQ